jgi:mycothiol system anti-sigma-R factor
MDCDKAIYRVYGYLDGELTVWRRWTIRRHLGKCPPCAQGFDFEVELRQVISSKCRDEMPPELKQRIAEALGLPTPSDAASLDDGGTTPRSV